MLIKKNYKFTKKMQIPKKKIKNKRISSLESSPSSKISSSFHQKLSDKLNKQNSNQNITNINNINIVNMIMNKEKPLKYKNISINTSNRSQYKKNNISIKKNQNTNCISLVFENNKKTTQTNSSMDELPKFKTNKLLFCPPFNHSRIIQTLKSQKNYELIKSKKNNHSCRNLANINIDYNNEKTSFIKKRNKKNKSKHKLNNINLPLIAKTHFSEIRGELRNRLIWETNNNNLNNTNFNNINISDLKKNKKNENNKSKTSEENIDIKDLLNDLNLNKETDAKDYIDSEINILNKQENLDYDKDLEFLKINSPYSIRVTKRENDKIKPKNISSDYKYNESITNLNISTSKKYSNLIKENIYNFNIKKSNIKYINNKKKIIFDNDEDIINFVKNKFKDKNSRYLSELQSKNYVNNIFGNNYNNFIKKKNMYTGLLLTKKLKGKTLFEIELENNVDLINRELKKEKFTINNELVLFTPVTHIMQLKEENNNIKNECNKIKEENKNIYVVFVKLKEEIFYARIKFGKLKNEYDKILKDLKAVNDKKKEYKDDISKKDILINNLEKKINDLQNVLSEFKYGKSNIGINNIFNLISKEIQLEFLNKKNKKFTKKNKNININTNIFDAMYRKCFNFVMIEKVCNLKFDYAKLKLFKNKEDKNESKQNKEIQRDFLSNLIIDNVQKLNYITLNNSKSKKSEWIIDENIQIEKGYIFNYINQKNKVENFNKNIFIIQKENDIYFNKTKNIEIKNNINNLFELENICNFNFKGIKNQNNIINIKKDLLISQIYNFDYIGNKNINNYNLIDEMKQNENSINKNMIIEHITDLIFEKIKIEKKNINFIIQQFNNIFFEGMRKNNNETNNKFNNDLKVQQINNINYNGITKEEEKNNNNKNNNLIIESISRINYEGVNKYYNINNNLIKETISNINYEGVKKDANKNKKIILEQINNLTFEGIRKEKNKSNTNLSIENISNLYFDRVKISYNMNNSIGIERVFSLYFEKTIKNINIYLNLEKVNYLFFEGIKKNNIINDSLFLENIFNICFEGIKSEKKNNNLNMENAQYLYIEGIKKKSDKNNNLQIEQSLYLFFDRIQKNLNIIIEKNSTIYFENNKAINKDKKNNLLEIIKNESIDFFKTQNNIIKLFNNNSIESVNIITIEKIEKSKKENNYEIQQNITFSFDNMKKNNNINIIKKFDILEISKDIKNTLIFENNTRSQNRKVTINPTKMVFDTPKKENLKSTNKAKTANIDNTISKTTETKKNNNNNINNNENKLKKQASASRAMNRIKKRNQTVNLMNSEVLEALENYTYNNSGKGGNEYRQSFRIMEIAKKLEREITKQGLIDDNKDKEVKQENNNDIKNNEKNDIVDIISKKPINTKKKKKNKIEFKG